MPMSMNADRNQAPGVPLYMYRLRSRGFRLRRTNEPPDEILLARRPLYYIALILVLFSGILRQPLLFVAGLFITVLAFIPELWYRYCLRQLTIERKPATTRAELGDSVEITLSIENRKPLPLPWLEIVDELPESLPVAHQRVMRAATPERVLLASTLSMWAYQRVRRRYSLRALARGAYSFGPMTLRATDPFGILTREITMEKPATLLIHPLVVPLERFGLPALAPFGERKAPLRVLEDPLRISGIRDYVPGDEPRRIHWKATARMGTLQSKRYEPSTSHTLAIFLDIRTLPQALMSYDPVLVELHICVAASVADWALRKGFAVSVYSNGTLALPELSQKIQWQRSPEAAEEESREAHLQREIERMRAALRLRIPASSRPEQLTTILDSLARLLPYNGVPIEQLILADERELPNGATIVYIGAENLVDVPLIVALRRINAHGHAVSTLLTQSNQTGDDGSEPAHNLQLSGLKTHYIGGRKTWEELLFDALGQDAVAVLRWQRGGFALFGAEASAGKAETGYADTLSDLHSDDAARNGDGDAGITTPAGGERRTRALVVE